MTAPHPVPPLLSAWLRERDQAALVDSGMHPLVIFTIAARLAGPAGLPVPVLEDWSQTVRSERVMLGQSVPRLLRQLRQAGLTDDAIYAALGLDGSLSFDENTAALEQEHQRARQHHIDMSKHYANVIGTARAADDSGS